jgi:hypothetical protein
MKPGRGVRASTSKLGLAKGMAFKGSMVVVL